MALFHSPLTERPGGPVDVPVNEIAKKLNVAPEQVLLAWVKAKGAVAVTYVLPPVLLSDRPSFLSFFFILVQAQRRIASNDTLMLVI